MKHWTNYGDEDIPLGPRLSAYPLHTDEWRQAFLERLTQVGYISLIEASERVYQLLIEPKDFHAALTAQLANVEGSGKLAIYNSLRKFLDDYLSMPIVPPFEPGESIDHHYARVMAHFDRETKRQAQLIVSFARVLNGEQPGLLAPLEARFGEVLIGPWPSPTELRTNLSFEPARTPSQWPSMADPALVESLVIRMLDAARLIPEGPRHKEELATLIDMWTLEFSPANPAYTQVLSPEGLSIFLRLRRYGADTPAEDFNAPIRAVLKETLDICLHSDRAFAQGDVKADMHEFRIESAIEDCQCFLRGYDNPAD